MIRLVLGGLWVGLVALGSAYATVSWHMARTAKTAEEKPVDGFTPHERGAQVKY